MGIEDIELDVGGTKFKGIWIAILASFATTIGGGIWAASEFFSRLEILEQDVQTSLIQAQGIEQRLQLYNEDVDENLDEFENEISVIEKQVANAGIDELQGKLAALSTNLQQILDRQQELLQIQDRIAAAEASMTEMQVTVQKAETTTKQVESFDAQVKKLEREVEDLWEGLDYLSNPYGS